ncbi:Protein CIA1 [Camellia lanceoleosa]|uniref:Protein CIA1 n=1 Tax=Camellia lanceoleosa TaxID=1840588 RepID=A0ACC0GFW3_9ERIC|nr:Protein CIA1 [Camellia lanceoleosa]
MLAAIMQAISEETHTRTVRSYARSPAGNIFAPFLVVMTEQSFQCIRVIATGVADNSICLFVENKDNSVDGPMYKLILNKENAHDMHIDSVQWSSLILGAEACSVAAFSGCSVAQLYVLLSAAALVEIIQVAS